MNRGDANIEKNTMGNRKGLRNVVTIGDTSFQYNPNKITKTLTSSLNKVTNTNQFEATHAIKRVYQSIRLKNALKSYAVKYKAEINDHQSMFNSYINSYSISSIKLKGLKGLSYLKYEYEKLNTFLSRNPNMKILIVVYVVFEELDEDGAVVGESVKDMRSRRYEVHNSHDLQDTLNSMAADIELQIEQKQLHKSKFRVKGIDKLVIHYDRYNPTRGGSYIELPKWIADKETCINIKNEDNKCSKYSIQCSVHKMYEKKNPQEIRHYSKLNDELINWEGMSYPAGNRDFDRL